MRGMKRKTYNNIRKATFLIMDKGYNFDESNQMAINLFDEHGNGEMSIEYYIDKIEEKYVTVEEKIKHGKANHQITHIVLKDAITKEKIGIFKHENDIPVDILQKPTSPYFDRAYGFLYIEVKMNVSCCSYNKLP